MRNMLLTIQIFIIIILCTGGILIDNNENQKMIVMTYNIRVGVDEGINSWENRKEKVAGLIKSNQSDIAGVQEALINQLNDLSQLLPEYEWFGVGRDDGKDKGEYSAVFYKKERFEVLKNSTFWLSETPEKVSVGWDAALPRIVTWGEMKDKNSGKTFYIFNTHFDHIGDTARQNSAKLILTKINEIAGDQPVIVTGDFNVKPDSKVYSILTDATVLYDAQQKSENGHSGSDVSFNGFGSSVEAGNKIDYIFVTEQLKVYRHGILDDTYDGNYPSDHMPVIAEVEIE